MGLNQVEVGVVAKRSERVGEALTGLDLKGMLLC